MSKSIRRAHGAADRPRDIVERRILASRRARDDRRQRREARAADRWTDADRLADGVCRPEGPSISQRRDGAWRHDRCDGYVIFRAGGWECGECGAGQQAEPSDARHQTHSGPCAAPLFMAGIECDLEAGHAGNHHWTPPP